MKRTSPLMLALCLAGASPSPANDWTSLSGIGDSVTLGRGETALIVSVSDELVVHYDKPGRHRSSFRLQPEQGGMLQDLYCYRLRRPDAIVSVQKPFILSGPALVSVRSPGVLTMQILGASDSKINLRSRQPATITPQRLPSMPSGWARLRP